MATLTRAHQELFRRMPDECFSSFDDLYEQCRLDREQSRDLWVPTQEIMLTHDLTFCVGDNPDF